MTARADAGLADLEARLRAAWSRETSSDPDGWSPANPAWGQCAVTAVAVRDALGGEVVWGEAELPDGRRVSHYWNRLPGGDADLTRCQFPEGTQLPPGGPRRPDVRDTAAYVLSHPATRARHDALAASLSTAASCIAGEPQGRTEDTTDPSENRGYTLFALHHEEETPRRVTDLVDMDEVRAYVRAENVQGWADEIHVLTPDGETLEYPGLAEAPGR